MLELSFIALILLNGCSQNTPENTIKAAFDSAIKKDYDKYKGKWNILFG